MVDYIKKKLGLKKKQKVNPAVQAKLRAEQTEYQLEKMVAFMKNDAEITYDEMIQQMDRNVKEWSDKIVSEEEAKIEEEYARKLVQLKKELNEQKVKVKHELLIQRQDALNACLSDVRATVKANLVRHLDGNGKEDAVKKFYTALLLEAAFLLAESTLNVKVRAQDEATVRAVLPQVQQYYREDACAELTMEISPEKLPDSCLGGVIVSSENGQIEVDNRLESRVDMCVDTTAPWMRSQLVPAPHRRELK